MIESKNINMEEIKLEVGL